MVHGGMKLIKFLLFLFNFVFWLSGIGLIAFGSYVKITNTTFINFLGNSYLAAPIILIVAGCIIAVLGFFGCCGAIRENYCMTMTFAVLLGIIFILELAAGIASYVLRNDLESTITIHVMDGMNNYLNRTYPKDVYTQAWDKMQQDFACCGTINFTDWFNTSAYRDLDYLDTTPLSVTTTFNKNEEQEQQKHELPLSCCNYTMVANDDEDTRNDCDAKSTNLHRNGCIDRFKRFVEENVAIVGGVGCGVAFIQIIGIMFACCLSKSILKDYEEYYY